MTLMIDFLLVWILIIIYSVHLLLVKAQTCLNLVKHLEKCVSTALQQQTGEGVPFEGTNENSSQPASVRPV